MSLVKSDFPGRFAALKPWLFPLGCVVLYGLACLFDQEKTANALRVCAQLFSRLGLPLCLALFMMLLINRFLSPSVAARLLGQGSGLTGLFLSTVAGILSVGPIYSWYPLFTTLKDKGVSSFNIANFMCNRSVKPVLLPVLVGYFGWKLAGIFLCMNFAGALFTAGCVALLCPFRENKD